MSYGSAPHSSDPSAPVFSPALTPQEGAEGATALFREIFEAEPDGVWYAPGRVNIIDENPLERSCQILFSLLFQTDHQFLLQQLSRSLCTITQQIGHTQEYRLVVHDDASIGRLAYLTVGKGIERIDGFVRRYTRSQMNTYIGFGSRHIIYSFDLDPRKSP